MGDDMVMPRGRVWRDKETLVWRWRCGTCHPYSWSAGFPAAGIAPRHEYAMRGLGEHLAGIGHARPTFAMSRTPDNMLGWTS